MTLSVIEKYEVILARERKMAYALAREVISRPQASAWMIFLPILFVHHAFTIQRYKKSIHGFAAHYLRTREKALHLAMGALKEGRGNRPDLETCFPSMELGDEKDRKVCEKQLVAIHLLFHHYSCLLSARGKTWENLVKDAYGNSGKYRYFLNELAKAEREVTRYVTRAFQTSGVAREIAEKMEKVADHFREEEMKAVF